MKTKISVLAMMLIFNSGCDSFKKITGGLFNTQSNPQTEGTATPATPAAQPAVTPDKCEDGSEPKVLTGICTGTYSVQVTDKNPLCLFSWGPKVSCPEGMKGLSAPGACYGVSGHPFPGSGTPTAETCLSKLGTTPRPPEYRLTCCPL